MACIEMCKCLVISVYVSPRVDNGTPGITNTYIICMQENKKNLDYYVYI